MNRRTRLSAPDQAQSLRPIRAMTGAGFVEVAVESLPQLADNPETTIPYVVTAGRG